MTFAATTVTAGGQYSPRNVGAIWVSTSDGRFVKTLRTWGGPVRLPNAKVWLDESEGDQVDAVTGATRPGHAAVDATWDCTDVTGSPVPAGAYRISVTFAEDNAVAVVPPPFHVTRVTVDTQERPFDRSLPDQPNFTAIRVSAQ